MYKHKDTICTGTLVCLAQVGFMIELHCLSVHHFGHQIIDNYLIVLIYNKLFFWEFCGRFGFFENTVDLSVELMGWLGLKEYFDKVMDCVHCLGVGLDL